MATSTWKGVSHPTSLDKCKLKSQWDIITHLLVPNVQNIDIKRWQECGTTGALIQCCWEWKMSTATLEDSLAVLLITLPKTLFSWLLGSQSFLPESYVCSFPLWFLFLHLLFLWWHSPEFLSLTNLNSHFLCKILGYFPLSQYINTCILMKPKLSWN